ncbi:HD domain-containing protein [Aureitalea marina]|uniref:Phosphohydrolase n=1 Tax=Aureitalea marina TaxID=930804 RepID=A0A2S7KPA6_9FLAO|nr:HD domain-containing protein [Aureitalea marina]PQB04455.1 phosphohydrolase [Aureitalea marina]
MHSINKLKIVNDPIYGFITIPNELIFTLVEHPYFQRLRRISQMGLSYLVYPGAHHTRFHHALGAMHLAGRALDVLQFKGVTFSDEERSSLLAAVLLHDIGHGPFSHAVEHSIVHGVSHEHLSLLFMKELNDQLGGKLDMAIAMFTQEYDRPFFHQLISGQLDVDRLDYLKRDSFYTGVSEGAINSERLISMLNIHDNKLVLEEKAIYSVEKFIIARRLMYWQVYLHKTGIVAEQLLIKLLRRARSLLKVGQNLAMSSDMRFFMEREDYQNFDSEVLHRFARLDDSDILWAMKQWVDHPDSVLSRLSAMILNRNLLKISLQEEEFSKAEIDHHLQRVSKELKLPLDEASFFVFSGSISNQAYHMDRDAILLLTKKGDVMDVVQASDQLNLRTLSTPIKKYYLCFPKQIY